jgi:thiamine biosynthesis lipoprotein ApbE
VVTAQRSTSFAALGTTALVAVDDPGALGEAEAVLRRELDRIDRACSRFRDDSELTAVNRAAGGEVAVSELLIEALEVALRAAAITDGDVDPTVGRAMGELGYDRDFSLVAGRSPGVRVRIAPVPGWRAVRVDRARGTVAVPRGVRLDLGATAKALAADRAARAVHEATGAGTLVSLGGDVALCGEAPGGGWPVRVTDDHRDVDGEGETIGLREGGLATSGTTVRRWGSGAGRRHHILDPRRGEPAEEVWRTVSVAAATCVDANIASTAAIIRGRRAPRWLAEAGLPARLVARDGEVLHVGDWPEPAR